MSSIVYASTELIVRQFYSRLPRSTISCLQTSSRTISLVRRNIKPPKKPQKFLRLGVLSGCFCNLPFAVGVFWSRSVLRTWNDRSIRCATKLRNRSHVSTAQPTSVDQPVDQARDFLTHVFKPALTAPIKHSFLVSRRTCDCDYEDKVQ